jgi:hypothetical protein
MSAGKHAQRHDFQNISNGAENKESSALYYSYVPGTVHGRVPYNVF